MTGGNKQKGKKRSAGNQKRVIEYADEINSLYALVISPLGDCKFLVHCNDTVDRIGVIRGSLYKNNFIVPGDLVLITLRDFEQVKATSKERCDIVIKYQSGEIEQLKRKKVFYVNSTNTFNLTSDKGTGKSSKDKDNDNEQISFDINVKPQKTHGDLPNYDSADDKKDVETQEPCQELTNLDSESSEEDIEEDELDEYGNLKNYVEPEVSESLDEAEDDNGATNKNQEKPIQNLKKKHSVYINDDDFM
jgi:translation initiation factor 1A